MTEGNEGLEKSLGDYKTKVAEDLRMTLELEKDLIFAARTPKGYVIDLDANMEWGCLPTESLLIAAAGCLAIDVVSFVRKMRAEITDFRIEATAKRNPTPPQYFKEIDLFIRIKGHNIDRRKMDRAIDLSREKYCSVYHTLRSDLTYNVKYEIIDEEG